ncbi:MAG: hypothetical protein HY785_28420 [Oscillatoriophycideae cyanobacterium NC_groundwater_1537_Pr4_S-0.65um_50_18]|nr:hypothetical protein [Oscillatoriophycideae cyanobacterium NC_groundwater_1537_Pr4_S-0.65um_50_18]
MSLEIVLTNVQLLLARPEEADLRKIQHYAAARGAEIEEVSYIVKLYIQTPPVYNSMGVELYVGNQQIRQYSQFKNGIYFKVNDLQQLSDLQGKEVRFHRPGSDEFISTGVRMPTKESVTQNLRAADVTQLPTQAEVLRE